MQTLTLQEKVERILKDNPKMPTAQLIRAYLIQFTDYSPEDREKFMEILANAYIPSITRFAAKYREKLGVRDEVRDQMAEQQRRYWPDQPCLELNPPKIIIGEQQKLFTL